MALYQANTLWAIARSLGGKKYRVKALSELLPPVEPERTDTRTGRQIMDSVLDTLRGLA